MRCSTRSPPERHTKERDGAAWEKWEDGKTQSECIPDLSMGWLDNTKGVELAVLALAVVAGDGPTRVKRYVVQDSWDEEKDVELRGHLRQAACPSST